MVDIRGLRSPTQGVHKNGELCKKLLSSVDTAASLQILPSTIPGAGSGVFTAGELAAGKEIFRVEPLVNCAMNELLDLTCDFCFYFTRSSLHPSGRFLTESDKRCEVKACSQCKLVRYCSKVNKAILFNHVAFKEDLDRRDY